MVRRDARYGCKLWSAPWFYCVVTLLTVMYAFSSVFLYQTFTDYVFSWYKTIVKYWYAKCDYKLWKDLWFDCVFGNSHIWKVPSNFSKLMKSRSACLKANLAITYGYVRLFFFSFFLYNIWIMNLKIVLTFDPIQSRNNMRFNLEHFFFFDFLLLVLWKAWQKVWIGKKTLNIILKFWNSE